VTGNVSNAIASLAKAWPGKNVTIVQASVGKQVTDCFVNMAYAMLVVIGTFVILAVIGHVTKIITGLAISLQATVLPVTVIAGGMGIIYSVGDGTYGVAVVAAVMLTVDSTPPSAGQTRTLSV
jgi:Na+/H+-translocating membrane pyrophosphatase